MAMPICSMSCFKLSRKMCKELSNTMASFWWGAKENEQKIHWVSWKKMTRNKASGGLDFKDLYCFNLAMLAKQLWRIITQPNLLRSKVIKARYVKVGSVLEANVPNNAS
ncbi:hypothetical protein ACH5RR_025785 [Cinchona calisaya]|uniref:Reverse transcriptase n=1 Tax=Cinchona calisaya TaxID=153742 RepID=A0ABD2Z1S3_9GENT